MRNLITLCGVAAIITAADARPPQPDLPVAQQAVVRLEDGVLIDTVNADYGTVTLDVFPGGSRPSYLLGLPTGLSETEFVELAEQDDRIKSAEFNFVIGDPDPGTQSFFFGIEREHYWGQPARGTIDLNRGPSFVGPPAPPAGDPMVVAVVDSGVDSSHPALTGRMSPDGVSLIPGDASTLDTGDGADNDNDGVTDEIVGHGTFVAGLIALADPAAVILSIRVVESDGFTTTFRVARGINEAVLRGARVINVSLGSTFDSEVLADAIDDAAAAGVIVVASAGNDGENFARFPASFPGVVSVAAVDAGDTRAPFSNFGPNVTICAPGVSVVSTTPGGGYASASGTSFAAPLVTATVSRMRAFSPAATAGQIRSQLYATAASVDGQNPGQPGQLGAGRVNYGAAVGAVDGWEPYIVADCNGDGEVNLNDLNLVLTYWQQPTTVGDADASGGVDFGDINAVLNAWLAD